MTDPDPQPNQQPAGPALSSMGPLPPAPEGPLDPLALTSGQFIDLAGERFGMRPAQALRAYRQVFRFGPRAEEHLSKAARQAIRLSIPPITRTHAEDTPEGRTAKFCQRVPGPAKGPLAQQVEDVDTESVIIPMFGRSGRSTYTLCVSSQIGCAMGCGFCETAQMGLIRNLTPSEIVAQWMAATFLSEEPGAEEGERGPTLPGAKRTIKNIVFMGMGEPMDNAESVVQAIRVLTDDNGPGIAAANITVSTVGRIDGIRRLGELVAEPGFHKLGLAVSVNAPSDTVRNEIMPINRAMPMAPLREALLDFPARSRNKICFEYVLIPGVNDRREHAQQLAEYLAPFTGDAESPVPLGVLNLIPYNPRRNSPWPAPSEDSVAEFLSWLIDLGVFAKRRRTKGRSQMAACGQLGSAEIRKRRYVGVGIDKPAPNATAGAGTQ